LPVRRLLTVLRIRERSQRVYVKSADTLKCTRSFTICCVIGYKRPES